MKLFSGFFFLLFCFAITSCSHKNFSHNAAYQFKSVDGKPDYSDLHYWAAHPWKWDPSDSVPKPLRKHFVKDSTVDVFFIYPTTLTGKDDYRWNAPIDDAEINAKTDYSTILTQASVFNADSRIFAPRYRQANLKSFYSANKDSAAIAMDIAYSDVKTAFEYYMKHYNNGRPIIIASHSQGTVHAGRLLKEFFEGKPLYNKLVCAYIIGMPTPEHYFTSIPGCKDSLATGCFVGWRSFHKDYTADYIAKEKFKSIVTNPLLWTSATTFAPAELNKGAVLLKFNKIIKHNVNAQIHDNVLWTSKPKFFGNIFFHSENYHIADYNMFYMNLRENVHTRIKMFWKQ
ncbi:MAG: DUF3089 domain-containing protein [Ferruginibacter sp.]